MPFNITFLRKNCTENEKTYKQRKSFAMRREEVLGIRTKFPNKIPIIVERSPKERSLPRLDKTKFLVPQELSMGKFMTIIRNRMNLNTRYSMHFMINNKTVAVGMTRTMNEIYKEHKDKDGFLYITYSSQEIFG
ncbi:microtubule-associated protein 1 light chain 3 gamma [Dermatophagoides farinae]|uniref:Microtubule-associated proteins 1A/1B light chain 3C n=1 Tax=Dermatophagoides farinae TaxID=6954 RepID=A0A922IFF4_DERFA|nr:microtubule-associated proteins 1A/1B light chain 3C-like [Dermatophagoides farinae]KAH7642540.1 microtubule-associated proteins 1a/1b light chain-like protein [Dermatophagoides farinae]KAH9529832.1 Microtubule-associated proteins 1A/1B light chain 3C [Dermatophagoides farinae]